VFVFEMSCLHYLDETIDQHPAASGLTRTSALTGTELWTLLSLFLSYLFIFFFQIYFYSIILILFRIIWSRIKISIFTNTWVTSC